ncbi:MAG: hypothetical protein H7A32_03640 [Deltaproteobacteria bacterium]|nr:hypothetical protein [Deltaproteobacteria bacterium]
MRKFSKIPYLTLTILLLLGLFSACDSGKNIQKEAVKKIPKKSSNSNNSKLNLKQGMKFEISTWSISPTTTGEISEQKREISIVQTGGVDGLSFRWQENELDLENQISLPNINASRKMLIPLFWPRGELYLSDYASIWFSDTAFEELRSSGKTDWSLGIENNPLLGPAQEDAYIRGSIHKFNQWVKQLAALTNPVTQKKFELSQLHVLEASHPYVLSLNEKKVTVDTVVIGNDLLKYKVLNNPQNPLVMELEFAPNLPVMSLAAKGLFNLKPLLEYHVQAIQILE